MSLSEVAPGIFLVPLPLPFALNLVNTYLIQDGDGWAVIDTGLHTAAGEAGWRGAFAELGLVPQAITRIVLTHYHPDHFGMAGWLQQLSGAPVLLAPREIELARGMWGKPDKLPDPLIAHYTRHGAPLELVEAIERTVAELRVCTRPHPELTPLPAGTLLRIGGRCFEAIEAPGHSDGQLIFYDRDDRLMLSGDHVLTKITPHIGLWPDSEPDPLGRYLASLAALRELDVRLALPGHKTLIADWRGRIDELAWHHDQRLAAMLTAAERGATAYEVARRVFPVERFSVHELRFAVAETIAHLELLANRGQLWREEGAVLRYIPT